MQKTALKYFLFIALFLLVVLAAAIVYVVSHDINDFKKEITSAFNESTGLEIGINGDIDFKYSDGINLNVIDVTLHDSLGILASFDSLVLRMGVDFGDSVNIDYVKVYKPVYYYRTRGIVPMRDVGSSSSFFFNMSVITIDTLLSENGRFYLIGEGKDTLVDVNNIVSSNGSMSIDLNKSILHSFQIENNFTFSKTQTFQINSRKADCHFTMTEGLLSFLLTSREFPEDHVNFNLDLNPDHLFYSFEGALNNRDLHSLYSRIDQSFDFLNGYYNTAFNFSFTSLDSLDVNSLRGHVTLSSNDLVLNGVDLDKLIKRYKRTQNFSLKDLGSVMLLGPWGLALSKGSDYAELAFISDKDSTLMETVYFKMAIDSGILNFEDAAFRTTKNRISLSGKIDAVNRRYENFSYALLDKNNCAEIREVFNGSFERTQENKGKHIKMLLGPITNIFKGTSEVIRDKDCVFTYKGIVEHPQGKGLFAKNSDGSEKKKEKKERRKKKKKKESSE